MQVISLVCSIKSLLALGGKHDGPFQTILLTCFAAVLYEEVDLKDFFSSWFIEDKLKRFPPALRHRICFFLTSIKTALTQQSWTKAASRTLCFVQLWIEECGLWQEHYHASLQGMSHKNVEGALSLYSTTLRWKLLFFYLLDIICSNSTQTWVKVRIDEWHFIQSGRGDGAWIRPRHWVMSQDITADREYPVDSWAGRRRHSVFIQDRIMKKGLEHLDKPFIFTPTVRWRPLLFQSLSTSSTSQSEFCFGGVSKCQSLNKFNMFLDSDL